VLLNLYQKPVLTAIVRGSSLWHKSDNRGGKFGTFLGWLIIICQPQLTYPFLLARNRYPFSDSGTHTARPQTPHLQQHTPGFYQGAFLSHDLLLPAR
jgi:hypothetical protein